MRCEGSERDPNCAPATRRVAYNAKRRTRYRVHSYIKDGEKVRGGLSWYQGKNNRLQVRT